MSRTVCIFCINNSVAFSHLFCLRQFAGVFWAEVISGRALGLLDLQKKVIINETEQTADKLVKKNCPPAWISSLFRWCQIECPVIDSAKNTKTQPWCLPLSKMKNVDNTKGHALNSLTLSISEVLFWRKLNKQSESTKPGKNRRVITKRCVKWKQDMTVIWDFDTILNRYDRSIELVAELFVVEHPADWSHCLLIYSCAMRDFAGVNPGFCSACADIAK